MFGSQALETAIGLASMLFVLATATSAVVELASRVMNKRAHDLERSIGALLVGSRPDPVARPDGAEAGPAGGAGTAAGALADVDDVIAALRRTAAYDAAQAGAGLTLPRRRAKRPSYLSARSYADAVVELIVDDTGHLRREKDLPPSLRRRLRLGLHTGASDLIGVKAHLERQFDDTMARAEGAYKRWASLFAGIVGLLLALFGNVSTINVAQRMWTASVSREAVVAAAGTVQPGQKLDSVATTTQSLAQLQLPVGWDAAARSVWSGGAWFPLSWTAGQWAMVAGWLLTAVLVMLGGPFWFDVLGRLVSLRSSGSKPLPAGQDPMSATSTLASTRAGGDAGDGGDSGDSGDSGDAGVGAGSFEESLARALGVPPPLA